MCCVVSYDRHMIHVGSEAPVVKRGPVSLAVCDVLQTSAALQRVDSTLSQSIRICLLTRKETLLAVMSNITMICCLLIYKRMGRE